MTRARTFLVLLTVVAAGCVAKTPPVAVPPPAPEPSVMPTSRPPAVVRPEAPPPPPAIPADPMVTAADPLEVAAIEAINKDSPLKPVFFAYDSDALDETARKVLEGNATLLGKYSTWVITIEGHCDERGTAEYNLALGDRRAQAAKNYLLSLGVPADRLRTVSYGTEFPFDPGHDEAAWANNRRAHFMLTSK